MTASPSLSLVAKLKEKITVRGCVELHMSGERSDWYNVTMPPSTWKPLSTGLRSRDTGQSVTQFVAPGQPDAGMSEIQPRPSRPLFLSLSLSCLCSALIKVSEV